jgi:hypothetical protein
MHDDITPLLKGWDYRPGEVTARRITGRDGRTKLQLRLDLGLLQLEAGGRPDGRKPHGAESALDHHVARLGEHVGRNGTELGFALDADACRELRSETVQYHYRCLCLVRLADWAAAEADAAHNLACLDFLRKHAAEDSDRVALEPQRPHLVTLFARARVQRLLEVDDFDGALREVRRGRERIADFFEQVGRPDAAARSPEIESLDRLAAEIGRRRPRSDADRLREQLAEAVAAERYEQAADLRDRLASFDRPPAGKLTDDAGAGDDPS